jgi:hypothetical protein
MFEITASPTLPYPCIFVGDSNEYNRVFGLPSDGSVCQVMTQLNIDR